RPASSWRGRVDREYLIAACSTIEAIGAIGLPPLHPASLDAIERRLLGNIRRDIRHGPPRLPTTRRSVWSVWRHPGRRQSLHRVLMIRFVDAALCARDRTSR